MKVAIVCLLSFIVTVYSGPVNNVKSDGGDLDAEVVPSNYNIDLSIDKDLKTYTGTVIITLTPKNDKTSIKLHSLVTLTESVKMKDPANPDDPSKYIDLGVPTQVDEMIQISYNSFKKNQKYELIFQIQGNLDENRMKGFYKSSYKVGTDTKYVASTQFEPTSARKAFPCFDEPQYKASFDIKLTAPKEYIVLSNQKGTSEPAKDTNFNIWTFEPTPAMSTYLVAFVIAPSDYCIDGNPVDTDIPVQLCSRSTNKNQMDWAKTVIPQVIASMGSFTGINYKQFGLKKLDNAAIPNFAAGAMENWGLVTYREAALVVDENSSEQHKQKVGATIAHELSHQWFGDYVTLKWWNDVFLNEGFATYFQYHTEVDAMNNWQLSDQFVVEQLQTALEYDATDDSAPLSSEPSSSDISARFDSISYNKGGSILRMVENFLTSDKFKEGLKSYLNNMKKNKEGSATASDLWNELNNVATGLLPTGKTLNDVMEQWTKNKGYPLLSVTLKDSKITITQEPVNSDSKDLTWSIPVTYITDKNAETTIWLTAKSQELDFKDQTWIIVNNGQKGYYRVNYDDALWNAINDAIKAKNDKIDSLTLAQLIDDSFYLANVEKIEYSKLFERLELLKDKTDYFAWYAAFRGFESMLNSVSDSALKTKLQNKFLDLSSFLYNGATTTHIDILRKMLANNWVCKLGSDSCINDAVTKFDAYIADKSTAIDVNDRAYTYCHGVKNTKTEGAWSKLWEKYTSTDSPSEKDNLLRALGCNEVADNLKTYLGHLLDENKPILSQDYSTVYSSVLANSKGVDAMIEFITTNLKNLKADSKIGTDGIKSLISSTAKRITSEAQITKLQTITDTDFKNTLDAAKVVVTNNLAKISKLEKSLGSYFSTDDGDGAVGITVSTTTLLLTVFLALYQLI